MDILRIQGMVISALRTAHLLQLIDARNAMNNLLVTTDLNLLTALSALIEEQSVLRASARLNLSASAMSRTLGRIQEVFGDRILVRAGRKMVLTDRAHALREPLGRALSEVSALLCDGFDHLDSERLFTIRANDGFIDTFASKVILVAHTSWPRLQLRFSPKYDKDVLGLRSGDIDLEIGVPGDTGPEILMRRLFEDRMVGIMRRGHPLSAESLTATDYVSFPHISVSRRGRSRGPIDEELRRKNLARNVIAIVPNIHSAIEMVESSDWLASVPERHTVRSRRRLNTFELPVETPPLPICMMWHPRVDSDTLHTGIRNLIVRVCCGDRANRKVLGK